MSAPRCVVTTDPIDPCELLVGGSGSDGAAILFIGWVRNHNEGREVDHLDYKAYPAMAEATLREIAEEARTSWEIGSLSVVHRIGRLEIGEASVAIAVTAPHRGDAYEASRYVIEQLKRRVPIWKREGYLEGDSDWLGGFTPQPAGEET